MSYNNIEGCLCLLFLVSIGRTYVLYIFCIHNKNEVIYIHIRSELLLVGQWSKAATNFYLHTTSIEEASLPSLPPSLCVCVCFGWEYNIHSNVVIFTRINELQIIQINIFPCVYNDINGIYFVFLYITIYKSRCLETCLKIKSVKQDKFLKFQGNNIINIILRNVHQIIMGVTLYTL